MGKIHLKASLLAVMLKMVAVLNVADKIYEIFGDNS